VKYPDFEKVISRPRMGRYLAACGGDTRKAMTLYRTNLRLSQELFTVISCFEVALRNAIDAECQLTLGNDWLRNAAAVGGVFDNPGCRFAKKDIDDAVRKLNASYTHSKLVTELMFGFWRYLFAANQFKATGRVLLHIFPAKPMSTKVHNYNNVYIFNQLATINDLRNRIAHHEPVCFQIGSTIKSTLYAREHFEKIRILFQWMGIDEAALLYGIDHINNVCDYVDSL